MGIYLAEEKMTNNLSRFVVIVWVFVVLVLTSNYTASLSSMLTVQKLQPAFRTINELITRGDYIGYQSGSFVEGLLKDMSVQSDRLKKYINFFEYAQALSNGSRNGGVSAIVDEVPYLKMLQAKNCSKYFMLDPIYKTAGFGFVSSPFYLINLYYNIYQLSFTSHE
ncbi:hypothetical protein CTI12_AA631700 [Artemisia annua]|uniref:Ionotropic glutamate receptor C-terminal domain-containing protein n=1 Tax=Artemisia annua TaxID=35608 RepID=A0A2U1K8M1_ARTAN|nr:hypothetical protein CTI12_AA631700 [Artemisia annua]